MASMNIKQGIQIDLSMIMGDFDDMSYTGKPKTSITLKRLIKRLKVGAVISPEYFSSSEVNQWILDGKNSEFNLS